MLIHKRWLGAIAVALVIATGFTSCASDTPPDEAAASATIGVGTDDGNDSSDAAAMDDAAMDEDEADGAMADPDATPWPTPTPVPDEAIIPTAGAASGFGDPPPVLTTDTYSEELQINLDAAFGGVLIDGGIFNDQGLDMLEPIRESGDVRLAWLLSDALRFAGPGLRNRASDIAGELMGFEPGLTNPWNDVTNRLIAWDIPAPPDYQRYKENIFTTLAAEWQPFFDGDNDIDFRHLSWGGVRIDDRPFDETDTPCNCIPAADNPTISTVAEAGWLEPDTVVFGVVINGEARAYPRQIMEVREMVNDTLGGRDIGMPYCTLCGSAQVYYTDNLPDGFDRPVLRTSGLLSRSNKFMYDLTTFSAIDTFTGRAISGPLFDAGIVLDQVSVATTRWSDWAAAWPETTVLTEDLALGRNFDFRDGRDSDGPIFPVGDVDPRFEIQADVLGVITPSGDALAVHVDAAVRELRRGNEVTIGDVVVELFGGGLRARGVNGDDLGTHQAFWFAWSQFHPDTAVWPESA